MRYVFLVLLAMAVVGAAQRVAVLTDVSGNVYLSSPEGRTPVKLLRVLEAGQQLELDPGARVALACYSDGRTDLATGPCRLEVASDRTRLLEGSPGQLKSLPPSRSRALVPRGENLERLGGSMQAYLDRGGVSTPPPFLCQMGVVFSGQKRFLSPPSFRIKAMSPAQLKIVDQTGTELWTTRTDKSQVRGPRLAPGNYTIKAVDEGGIESELAFQVLSTSESDQVGLARKDANAALKARKDDLSPHLLLIGVYLEQGLLGEAWDETAKVSRKRSDDPQSKALMRSVSDLLWPSPALPR
ncbi:MAG: hypothetical protein AMXMBFR33_10480 [Candidatus Xenobia bacterium]